MTVTGVMGVARFQSMRLVLHRPTWVVSVYRKSGSTLIALASWAPAEIKVKLAIDWQALGLSPHKTTLWAPACEGFQNESLFAADVSIPVAPGKGWLLIAD